MPPTTLDPLAAVHSDQALTPSHPALRPDARVLAPNGEAGRLKHIILDPETHALSQLVVQRRRREILVPADGATLGADGLVHLRHLWSFYERQGDFDHGNYHPAARSAPPPVSSNRAGAERTDSGLRVTKKVVERIEVVSVPVREEHVIFQKLPGHNQGSVVVDGRELAEGESIDILVSTERVSVNKHTIGVNDVHVQTQSPAGQEA